MSTDGFTRRMMSRRVFLTWSAAGAGLGLLQACAPAAPAPAPTAALAPTAAPAAKPTTAAAPATPPTVASKATTAPAAAATTGPAVRATAVTSGALSVAIDGDADNLDPHVTSTESYLDALGYLVYDFLTATGDKMQLVPRLATKWDYTPDAKSVTVTLRTDAKFTNGTPITAKEVSAAIERAKNKDFWTTSRVTQIQQTTMVDDHTLKFDLAAPNAYFMSDMTDVAIVPADLADQLKDKPLGSGPYKFVEHVRNDHWTLEANKDYWDAANSPKLDRFIARILPDVSSAIANLQSGQIQAVRRVAPSDTQPFTNNPSIQIIKSPPGADVHFVHMTGKNNAPILQNKMVRQALAYALDRDAANQVLFGGEGQAIGSPLSPSLPQYYDPKTYTFDPQKTKQLLDQAGVRNLEFTIDTIQGVPAGQQVGQIWQQGLEQAGVKLNIRNSEQAAWLDRYLKQDYDVIYNTFPPTGDPNRFFSVIINRFVRAGVYTAENGYDQNLLTDLMPAAKAELDPQKAMDLLKRMQQMASDELPVLPVAAGPTFTLAAPKVQRWVNLPNSLTDLHGLALSA